MTPRPYRTGKDRFTVLIAAANVYAHAENPHGTHPAIVTLYSAGDNMAEYFGDLKPYGYVIDKRPCLDHPDMISWVVRGPDLNEQLPSKTKEVWYEQSPCSSFEECMKANYISLDLYVDLWRSRGAKIGKRVKNEIRWEDKTVTKIPSFEERHSVVSL